ncbi:uncharacterized protein LOC116166098 isoform X2 [Photinus pyralis]|uniref:uncharacterized protein LOC116166098 isoform X2 n=1 Tax=Photinus pyralis TaxID=7054 RepID=UPI001266EF4C|nr:uncharacterized protein LOC116166098 isoform X2 [Photinus pyralis]
MSFRQNNNQDVYQYPYNNSHSPYGHHAYISDGNGLCGGDESSYWTSNSPRSDTPSPSLIVGRNPFNTYASISFSSGDVCQSAYRSGCNINSSRSEDSVRQITTVPYVRVVKRRTTANKKERRRTQSINNAYADLRDCIPNVPADTKLSKTLRLATSYIAYLTAVLENDEPAGGFKVELNTSHKRSSCNTVQPADCSRVISECDISQEEIGNCRRAKGRTGWPQHVWALELKQEQAL